MHRPGHEGLPARILSWWAVPAVAVILTACGSDDPTGPAENERFSANEWVYFVATTDPLRSQLFRVRPDGSDAEEVLRGGDIGSVLDFDVSPDRSRIAVVVSRLAPGDDSEFDLVLVDATGGVPTDFAATDPGAMPDVLEVRWSPDGTGVAVTASQAGQDGTSYRYLAFVQEGGTPTSLTPIDDSPEQNPRWSSDGRTIAFLSRPSPAAAAQLHLVERDGSDRRKITEEGAVEATVWSPVDDALVFTSWRDENFETDGSLYLLEPGRGDDYALLLATSLDRIDPVARSWSPDGQWIAVVARDENGVRNVHLVSADGDEATLLLSTTGDLDDPTFSADGRHVVAAGTDGYLRIAEVGGEWTGRIAAAGTGTDKRRVAWVTLPGG